MHLLFREKSGFTQSLVDFFFFFLILILLVKDNWTLKGQRALDSLMRDCIIKCIINFSYSRSTFN